MITDYEKQVYTAVMGKVIGVYFGRPFEGWKKRKIEEKWGSIDRYVHEDMGCPLVVADDDISGTFAFVRILEDAGFYEKTPDDLYGENWLNYIIMWQTILWWGGYGIATEHTAMINLKRGIPAPRSGSCEINGKEISEQIGAQIFIDAFGMVAAGQPALAAELAGKAARVSHDGEAVYAAQVVAVMVSMAFEEKDMDRLLDAAMDYIPKDSLIAQLHRDVRAWAKVDGDWRKTYDRIEATYGYRHFNGCHVIPNHALMVMAWAYAKNDFFEAMRIVNTAGWDTDCNSANVGTVTALVAGLEHLNDRYDFTTPFAGRMYLPKAEGTETITDTLTQAMRLARVGRRILGMEAKPAPKGGVYHHFEMEGAVQGYQGTSAAARATNVAAPAGFLGSRCLSFAFDATAEASAKIQTLSTADNQDYAGNYKMVTTPLVYPGMTVRTRFRCADLEGTGTVRFYTQTRAGEVSVSDARELCPGADVEMTWTMGASENAIQFFGFEVESATQAKGTLLIDYVDFGGTANLHYPIEIPHVNAQQCDGWISSMNTYTGPGSNDTLPVHYISRFELDGILVTGDRRWKDATIQTNLMIRTADRAGFYLRYQGLRRYYAALITKKSIQIVRNYYGEHVLAEIPFVAEEHHPYRVSAGAEGDRLWITVEGGSTLEVHDTQLTTGGIGFYLEYGVMGFWDLAVTGQL